MNTAFFNMRMTLLYFWMALKKSLKSSLDLLFQCAKYSGLTPNFEKTAVIWIGSKINSADKFCLEYNLDWAEGDFTILGVKFNAQLENIEKISFESKINMIKKDINHWSTRNLTPLGFEISALAQLFH